MSTKSTLLPIHTSGNTWCGVDYFIKNNSQPLDLTNVEASMYLKGIGNNNKYKLDLVIKNPLLGEIGIPKQIINWEEDNYNYEVIFSFPNGDRLTFIRGIFPIESGLQ